jgi:hypothetical protein
MINNQTQDIQDKINSLKVSFCEDSDVSDLLDTLHAQLELAKHSESTRKELSELIKSEDDVLDLNLIDEDTELYEDIRNIQDQIINFFGI